MSKHKHKSSKPPAPAAVPEKKHFLGSVWGNVLFVGVVLAIVLTTKYLVNSRSSKSAEGTGPALSTNSVAATYLSAKETVQPTSASHSVSTQIGPSETNKVQSSTSNVPSLTKPDDLSTLEINHAVMVTVELDFGPQIPSIAEALNYIERRSKADDGSKTRTFAILDAYGEPTPDQKKLHMSMHISTEKPGLGSLVFMKTKEVLWQAKIVATTNTPNFSGKNLTILLDTGAGNGKAWTIDGSSNPSSILEANIHELKQPVRDIWPDGTDREVTFIYSACGCPVKVMVRRVGNRTVRAKDLPVIFPDDPAVVGLISQLMGW